MKKLLVVLMMLIASNVFAISDWRQGNNTAPITGGQNPSDLDTNTENYAFAPLDKLLTNYVYGCTLTYASASTITVGIGEVNCTDGTIHRFRKNTATVTLDMGVVGVGGIDSGSGAEAADQWYSVYAVADASATTFTVICGKQGTALSDVTYYRYIGSFYNNTGFNIANFNWFGKGSIILITWDLPVNITTAVSAGAWSGALSCSAGMPSTSTMGLFGGYIYGTGSQNLYIRANGGTSSVGDYDNALATVTSAWFSNGHLTCATDSSQQIQQYTLINSGGGTTISISLLGYYLNR